MEPAPMPMAPLSDDRLLLADLDPDHLAAVVLHLPGPTRRPDEYELRAAHYEVVLRAKHPSRLDDLTHAVEQQAIAQHRHVGDIVIDSEILRLARARIVAKTLQVISHRNVRVTYWRRRPGGVVHTTTCACVPESVVTCGESG